MTTTVLERGITIKGLQVIIINADSPLYDEASLVQIAGRVGRKNDEPTGEVIFITTGICQEVDKAIANIKDKNTYLQNVFNK